MNGEEYRNATLRGVTLCENAKHSGLAKKIHTIIEMPPHPQAVEMMKFLETLDILEYDSHFGWIWKRECGDGEILLCQLNTYFKQKDIEKKVENEKKISRTIV